jgi:uridine kinase
MGDYFYAGGDSSHWMRLSADEKASKVIDWRRLRAEALEPLRAGMRASYHPFDWRTWMGLAPESIDLKPARVVIVDGVYSARPELRDLIDLAVLIEMPKDAERRRRLIRREGAGAMAEWHAIWDEAEDHYFTHVRPPTSFDLRVISSGNS